MKQRFKEPSTWGGIGLLLMSLNQIFDINEAGTVGQALSDAAHTGNIQLTIGAGIAALASIFLKEKKP
jgi:hypothetical protein